MSIVKNQNWNGTQADAQAHAHKPTHSNSHRVLYRYGYNVPMVAIKCSIVLNFDTTVFCHVLWIMNACDYYLFMDRKVMVVDASVFDRRPVFVCRFFVFVSFGSMAFSTLRHTRTSIRSPSNARARTHSIRFDFIAKRLIVDSPSSG